MLGLIQEGNGEEHVRLSEHIEHAAAVGPRQVRVEVMAAGVCGSDLSCVTGKYYMPTPLVPGHEAAGVVAEVGAAVTQGELLDFPGLSKIQPLLAKALPNVGVRLCTDQHAWGRLMWDVTKTTAFSSAMKKNDQRPFLDRGLVIGFRKKKKVV